MNRGDLVFIRTNTLLSRIIRFFDNGKFNHVAIAVSSTAILDARSFGGVQIRPFDFDHYEVVKVDNVSLKRAEKRIGQSYDILRFLWYGLKFGDKPWNSPKQMICSELIGVAVGNNKVKAMPPNEQYRYFKRDKRKRA